MKDIFKIVTDASEEYYADPELMESEIIERHIADCVIRELEIDRSASEVNVEAVVRLPPLNEQVKDILGRPNFTLGHIARRLREQGMMIEEKAEDDQACVIYWMLELYVKFGDNCASD